MTKTLKVFSSKPDECNCDYEQPGQLQPVAQVGVSESVITSRLATCSQTQIFIECVASVPCFTSWLITCGGIWMVEMGHVNT